MSGDWNSAGEVRNRSEALCLRCCWCEEEVAQEQTGLRAEQNRKWGWGAGSVGLCGCVGACVFVYHLWNDLHSWMHMEPRSWQPEVLSGAWEFSRQRGHRQNGKTEFRLERC